MLTKGVTVTVYLNLQQPRLPLWLTVRTGAFFNEEDALAG
jgi:hypothetical protein